MAKIELSLHKNYVPNWSTWEGIREIMQNAMDENDKGSNISVVQKGTDLIIGNEDSELTIPNLLIGYTTKANDKDSRGEKGEGLDLGLLALTREGFNVEVRTPTETWTPSIEMSDKWGEEVLFINTRKVNTRRQGTYITIKGVTEELWQQIENRFLDFHEYKPEDRINVFYHGDLLLENKYRGKIYVKGIFVQTDSELKFGYNLDNVSLDRDRRMVVSHDLGYHMSKILSDAVRQRPEKMKSVLWEMLNNEEKDIQGFNQWNTDDSMKETMAKMFEAEHGEDAVPVSSMGDSEEMRSFGRHGVVAPRVLLEIVGDNVESPEAVRKKMASATTQTLSWDDLSEGEQGILKRVADTIDVALRMFRGNHGLCRTLECMCLYAIEDERVLDKLKVVEFRKLEVRGLYRPKDDEIQISRSVLVNYHLALRVIIHEVGHWLSGGGDAKVCFEDTTEAIWMAVIFSNKE